MADFIQNQGPLSQMSEEESPRLRTAPMSSYLSPAMAQEEEQAPEDNVSALYRQAKEKLMASRATGMDPLTTFLLAASQPGAGGTWGGISRGGIAAQQAMDEQAKSEEERQLKLLTLGIEEGKYKKELELQKAKLNAKEPKTPDLYYKVGPDGKQYGPYNINDPNEYKLFSEAPGKGFKVGTEPAPDRSQKKPPPQTVVDKLIKSGATLDVFSNLQENFENDFGGIKVAGVPSEKAGDLINWLGKTGVLSKKTPMSDWWRNYNDWVSEVRKDRFGQTLTTNELLEFNKIKINPSTDPEVIKRELQRQKNIVATALVRKAKLNIKNNVFDKEDFYYGVGKSLEDVESLISNPSLEPSNEEELKTKGVSSEKTLAPEGVPQELWDEMPPEDKSKWPTEQ